MFTCILCPKTKGLMNEITNQFKGLTLKNARAHRRKKKQQEEEEEEEVADEDAMDKNEQEEEEEEWIAESEPGIFITLVALTNGTNRLKKIRFSEEMYDVLGAQRWWNENYQKVRELYNIHQEDQPQSKDEYPKDPVVAQQSGKSSTTSDNSGSAHHSKEDAVSIENQTETETEIETETELAECVVEDEPGVFVTVRSLPDGSREILRVELSRERFGEVKARVWWEENKARLHKQYS